MPSPLVSIGFMSCNRLHYLRATLESAKECIQYPNIEWIVVDNASIEEGLREYVEGLDWVDRKIFREKRSPTTEMNDALNTIVQEARGDYVILLPEDLQFIVRGEWMHSMVELAAREERVGNIVFNALRRVTLSDIFTRRPVIDWVRPDRQGKVYRAAGREFWGMGYKKPGIVGGGEPTFARTEVWRRLGPWKNTGTQTVGDATSGGEKEMLERYASMDLGLERVLLRLPVAADIVTDPQGTKGRIRGNRRYGRYVPPVEGDYYYRIYDEAEAGRRFAHFKGPIPFEEIVEPIGFELPFDEHGNLLKNPHQSPDDPFEWIHPSVEGVDIR